MKTLEELMAIKEKTKEKMTVREDQSDVTRVVVGMATCGIAAGARPVLNAFMDEVEKRHLQNVTVAQTGCIGMCQYEPIVEILEPGKEKGYLRKNDGGKGCPRRNRSPRQRQCRHRIYRWRYRQISKEEKQCIVPMYWVWRRYRLYLRKLPRDH